MSLMVNANANQPPIAGDEHVAGLFRLRDTGAARRLSTAWRHAHLCDNAAVHKQAAMTIQLDAVRSLAAQHSRRRLSFAGLLARAQSVRTSERVFARVKNAVRNDRDSSTSFFDEIRNRFTTRSRRRWCWTCTASHCIDV